jgi:hypothetical protein
MDTVRMRRMIRRARQKFKKIYPCSPEQEFDRCFTIEGEKLLFWFNTDDCSTHLLISESA